MTKMRGLLESQDTVGPFVAGLLLLVAVDANEKERNLFQTNDLRIRSEISIE
jgi:hypothetical protein